MDGEKSEVFVEKQVDCGRVNFTAIVQVLKWIFLDSLFMITSISGTCLVLSHPHRVKLKFSESISEKNP